MRNRLTFPSAGTETKYVWDKYSLNNNGIYKWDKHDVINETKYYWDKYSLIEEKDYYWKKYSLNQTTTYSMNRYNIIQSSDVYGIYQRATTEATKYLNLNNSVSKSTRAEYAYSKGTYIYFITVDGKNVRYTQADVIANPMLCNPYFYGYCGITSSSSYKHASFYFTDQTEMKISADGTQIIFTNTYNYYAVTSTTSYPKGLTDSPTGTAYIEVKLKWPNMSGRIYDVLNYPKTGAKPKTSSYIQGNAFYDFMNDGLWQNQEPVYMVDYSNHTVITTTDIMAVKSGLDSTMTYYYEYIGQETEYSKGDYIEEVTSTSSTTYPVNGYQGNYWYETILIGSHYWNKYNTKVSNYLYNSYKYNATVLQKIVCQRFKLSKKGVTFVCPTYGTEGDVIGYEPVTGGELTDIYWPEGGSTDIAFWLTLDDFWNSTYYIDKNGLLPIGQASNYTESLTDYNNYVPEEMNRLYGKEMLKYTTIVGIGFRGTDWSRDHRAYLFTPNTVWGRESGTGRVLLNDVIPLSHALPGVEWHTASNLCWQFGNTATEENGGYYVDYIYTGNQIPSSNDKYLLYDQDRTVDKDYIITDDNPLFYEIPAEIVEIRNSSGFGSHANSAPAYKDTVNGYYYIFYVYDSTMAYGCYYDGEKGEFIGTVKYEYDDLTERYPLYLPTQTSTTTYYELVGEEYGKGNTLIGQVSSRQEDAYPTDGMIEGDNSAYYVYSHFEEEDVNYLKGDYIGEVESTDPDAYPQDKNQDQNWYIYKRSQLFQYIGSYIEEVIEERLNAYPENAIKGEYWYVYTGFENNGPYKSKWIQQVETNEQNTYPQDGINGYYWYVYNKSYEGYKLQIEDSQIRGGIDYKHNVNPEEDYTIGCVASAEIEFDYDNRNGDIEQYLNEEYCDYYTWQPNDEDWRLIGRFYLDNVNHNRKLVNIKAFDAIGAKCEKFVDEFIANYTFPTTLRDFFGALCAELGVTGSIDTGLVNAGFSFGDNFEAINITGRQLLQYIAEMSCGFIKAKPDDTIILTTYKTKELDLTNSQYTNTSIANYSVDKVEGLTVRTTDDDYGVSAGLKEGNRYIIENNPLFYAQSDDEIQAPVNNIYNKLKGITYTPADIELLQDFGIECGDIITLNGKTFYVMEKELSASGCKLKCFGNKVRAKQESGINSDIVALRGKTNELYRDLEMTQSTLTDRANGLQSQITQTAEEINLRVTNEVAGLESEISQTAEQISLRVTNEVAGLESKITQTADSITSTVTDQINETKSEIKQTTDSISLQVDSQGELVAQLVLDVNGINARGYVTFTDLAGTGTTVINGSNITTGTISADRINMRGAISWGDLDEDCKDTIASYAGQDGDDADVPDYIHNTYIDATRIVSPTIQGGTLSAGTTADGYMKLSSTGLNFHSSEKPICGIGYYSGNKELPYIVLGAGVDDYGTDKGMIKKYTNGIWIGDGDGLEGNSPTGTGIFINFNTGAIQKYVNGSASAL